ncbi:hypothetical protein SDC9_20666 [bioreactor metagenome]|uniref:Uncharacterized protein n=1 Tax=bioreactor metagenome TaxID=1076179 RepID=A0A644U7C3_9ZZZZ
MKGAHPKETFPEIGTVDVPALFSDGEDLLLSYEVAPVAGGGIAILKFSDVIYFEQNPNNVKGIRNASFPASPWEFTEVFDSDRTTFWTALEPRFWTISFNDVTVEVVFSKVQKVHQTCEAVRPAKALADYLSTNAR